MPSTEEVSESSVSWNTVPAVMPHLLLAPVALKQLARLERAQATVAAGRAGKPLAPAHVEKCLPAGLLIRTFSELGLARPLTGTATP